jgi:hypothetical protein
MIVPRRGATVFLTPVPGVELFSLLSGGLRYASTTGYYLPAPSGWTHLLLPPGGTDFMGPLHQRQIDL